MSSVPAPSSTVSAKARSALLAAIIALPVSALYSQSQVAAAPRPTEEIVVLDAVNVTENRDDQAPLNVDGALRSLSTIAGNVSVIDSKIVGRGRVGTAADVLAYQPGVFAQSTGGQDALRVSIRCSGINRGQGSFREGITFLFDGLPLTGPGGSPYELFEPLGLSYTEVLRGAAGARYGGLALGGAINYVSNTGYDASAFEARVEAGSFGYYKGQIGSGQVIGNHDYYATVIGSQREGFQALTEGESARVIANYGYKFNENVTNRVYFRFGATTFENPGNLTLSQIEKDPTQATGAAINNSTNPLYYSRRIQQGSTWVADKLAITPTADSKLDLGIAFHDYPIDIQGATGNLGSITGPLKLLYPEITAAAGTPVYRNTVPGPALGGSRSVWVHQDLSLSARYTRNDAFFDKASKSTAGVLSTVELEGNAETFTDNSRVRRTQPKLGILKIKLLVINGRMSQGTTKIDFERAAAERTGRLRFG